MIYLSSTLTEVIDQFCKTRNVAMSGADRGILNDMIKSNFSIDDGDTAEAPAAPQDENTGQDDTKADDE